MPEEQWYYLRGGEAVGPVDTAEIKARAAEGILRPEDLVWKYGLKEWVAAATFDYLFPVAAEVREPRIALPPAPPVRPAVALAPGGIVLRGAAFLVDLFLLGAITALALAPFLDPEATSFADSLAEVDRFQPILVASFCLYFALQESSPAQATIGKRLFGLVVTDQDGHRIGFLRAAARNLGKYLSGALLFLGFLMAAFTQRGQSLHDLIAQCLVVRRPRSPRPS